MAASTDARERAETVSDLRVRTSGILSRANRYGESSVRGGAERRATEVREQIHAISAKSVDHQEVAAALARFDPVWNSLTPREQARMVELLVERVDYDGARGKVAVTFHPNGIREFGKQFADAEDAA